jgi:hypothetical protein
VLPVVGYLLLLEVRYGDSAGRPGGEIGRAIVVAKPKTGGAGRRGLVEMYMPKRRIVL